MRILVSNDDGINAPGLAALANAMQQFGEVYVVAPDRNRSGASNSLTLSRPLRVTEHGNNRFSIDGTPTDCVHLAITGLLPAPPDLVVSGVNAGANLGDDVFYSGTVAAAMEGRFMGLPSLAISLAGEKLKYYESAAHIAVRIVEQLLHDPLPRSTILNINIPELPLEKIKSVEITRLGTRHCAEPAIASEDPRGAKIYWIGLPGAVEDAGPGTDFFAIKNDQVSITPLQLDLTQYQLFEQISSWLSRRNFIQGKK
ncbi:MAG: 5'/3'-nucleotidase SurE [Legionellales bacterium]|nr:5'/3'-nucleotidase SurE [Legionellales bacterium]